MAEIKKDNFYIFLLPLQKIKTGESPREIETRVSKGRLD